jgi:hypothetical protein
MKRRDFLQMLGIGGATLAVSTTAAASPIVPLFSGKESKIWTPEHASLTRNHLVLVRPPEDPFNFPATDGMLLAPTDEALNIPAVRVLLNPGQDPHGAFYKAAIEMRRAFSEESLRRFAAVPKWKRQGAVLVTLVDTEIFVGPLETNDDGFYLEISYTPYHVSGPDFETLNLNGWGVYSENGEYPIEVPTEIDMDRLLHVDTEIFTGKTNLLELQGKIIVP